MVTTATSSSTVSFWEREHLLCADCIIVGGGIIGLSAAISLKQINPSLDVVILEREVLPSGASTKNAGFACYGSLTEVLHDISTMGLSETLSLIEHRKRGLDLLRSRLGDKAIGLEKNGGYELLFTKEASERFGSKPLDNDFILSQIEFINAETRDIFPQGYVYQTDEQIIDFGFESSAIAAMVCMPNEASIQTGSMMKHLVQYAASQGVRILTGCSVLSIEDSPSGVVCMVQRPVLGDSLMFRAERGIVCTNALIRQFFPQQTILPGRGQVLVTHPIPGLPFRGVFHFDEGYYYFRNVGNRVLFGGGRNTDFATETTSSFGVTDTIQNKLEMYLRDVLLPSHSFEVDIRWSGIMGFSDNKLPRVEQVSTHITLGFGCNGMGIALGSSIGNIAAQMSSA